MRRSWKVALSVTVGLAGALAAAVVVVAALSGGPAPTGAAAAHASLNVQEAFARLPLRFEPNRGQSDARVAFLPVEAITRCC